jgi:hypothetical protein
MGSHVAVVQLVTLFMTDSMEYPEFVIAIKQIKAHNLPTIIYNISHHAILHLTPASPWPAPTCMIAVNALHQTQHLRFLDFRLGTYALLRNPKRTLNTLYTSKIKLSFLYGAIALCIAMLLSTRPQLRQRFYIV